MAVAHKLRRDLPQLAFLRRHPCPDERRINIIAEYVKRFEILLLATIVFGVPLTVNEF